MSGVAYVGSKISLISKSDIRYVGILHVINQQESTVALEQVRSFGTEGRKADPAEEIPPSDQVFDYIVFRGSDIKDLHVIDAPQASVPASKPQIPNDPAILGTQIPQGHPNFNQNAPGMSQIPPLPSNIQLPPGINPYLIQQAIAFQQAQRMGWTPGQPLPPLSVGQGPLLPGQPANFSQPFQANSLPLPLPQEHGPLSSSTSSTQPKHIGESNTRTQGIPTSQHLKIPTSDIPIQVKSAPDKDHLSTHDQLVSQAAEGLANISVNDKGPVKTVNDVKQTPRRDTETSTNSGPPMNISKAKPAPTHRPDDGNKVEESKSNQGTAQTTQSTHHRPGEFHRGRGRGRGYYGHSDNGSGQGRPRGSHSFHYNHRRPPMKNRVPLPDSDFDFEQSNAKFDKGHLKDAVAKKEKEDDKNTPVSSGHDSTETAHPSDRSYNKASFFDDISCETKERLALAESGRTVDGRAKRYEDRRLNLETFGQMGSNHYGRGFRRGNYSRRGHRGHYQGQRGGSQGEQQSTPPVKANAASS